MDNFTYCTPTKYVFGRGAEEQAGTEARASGTQHHRGIQVRQAPGHEQVFLAVVLP